MRRLYPVPFRMIETENQFKKWQWIGATIEKATTDHRPESHRLYSDTITCGDVLDRKQKWASRRVWLKKIPAFEDLDSIDTQSTSDRISLALARPKQLLELEIIPDDKPDWTEEERGKLLKWQMQGELFSEEGRSKMWLRSVSSHSNSTIALDATHWAARENFGTKL